MIACLFEALKDFELPGIGSSNGVIIMNGFKNCFISPSLYKTISKEDRKRRALTDNRFTTLLLSMTDYSQYCRGITSLLLS